MKKLIINADDCALAPEIDEAIKECLLSGNVSGVSVVANGDNFTGAVRMLKEVGKTDVGAHLLVNKGYIRFAADIFSKKITAGQIYEEFNRQITKIKDAGLKITHLDGHEHIHLMPGVLGISIKLALEHDIPYIRLPNEPAAVMGVNFSVKDLIRYSALKPLAVVARGAFKKASISFNDTFLGHFHSGKIDEDTFRYMMKNIKFKTAELAVHLCVPSEKFYKKYPWYENTINEFKTLTSRDWKKELRDQGINLIGHE